ncbi:transcriptional regulator [Alcanivorax hongdengensis A-11-3]|uniref:Transcriptional regulator n=1 Tax=Alcanivorax hongdengensis A-11-3 TaxID=1177179 RepID=L0WGF8_9GAMM|nr:AraC family transcriptional regulator [Alcanivorax hongdengensis]EKF75809.1 transcriptional regulator [Alcanivorax hongdengensis A-11-3]
MTSSVKTAGTLYLWQQRTLYLGYISRLSSLSQGANTLLFGLDDVIPLKVGGLQLEARSYLVPAGARYSADSLGKRIACCFLDPLGKDMLFHSPAMAEHESGISFGSMHEASQLHTLQTLYRDQADAGQAYRALEGQLFPEECTRVEGFEPDARIAEVVALIRSDPSENLSNEALAQRVGLSGDRLQRLFKQTTGIPIRRYRLWHRLFVTSSMMAMGATLTDAALAAGFSDSSHLAHVFKSMLGMSPSTVLRRSRHVRILVG